VLTLGVEKNVTEWSVLPKCLPHKL
jgi:hypothetical protein